MIEPQVLIISNKFDFATDLITNKLRENNVEYLRLNRDQLDEYEIVLDPIRQFMNVKDDGLNYKITSQNLSSIYYRAPTFLRDIFQDELEEEEQLFRTQWAAFVRSVSIFENVKWVNNPLDVYKAEIKPLQLLYAKKAGFNVPETMVTNVIKKNTEHKIAIKSIDTAIINKKNEEAFIYTTIYDVNELEDNSYSSPFFIQRGLTPKTDVRVTIIDNEVIAVKIKGTTDIDIDWRRYTDGFIYELFTLPEEIKYKCLQFAKSLNLIFAAIDLIIFESQYYFIEVNPTGEWSWLQKNTNFKFDSLIAKSLYNGINRQ